MSGKQWMASRAWAASDGVDLGLQQRIRFGNILKVTIALFTGRGRRRNLMMEGGRRKDSAAKAMVASGPWPKVAIGEIGVKLGCDTLLIDRL
ncbi:UNVERIFIED_CONTAM: hypothetical protein Sradi_6824600 [Sesamum radiatum]|uniref:Uncharacterized protein n=1 Tax=Sesamum radiatum TaxID=300843 RepID=A0AAW2JSV0_SESRA